MALKILSLAKATWLVSKSVVTNKFKELLSGVSTAFLFQIYRSPRFSLVILKRNSQQLMILYMSGTKA